MHKSYTLDTALETFDLEEINAAGIFAASEPMEPSELLTAVLARNIPLSLAVGTEKVKSELIIANLLDRLDIPQIREETTLH